MEENQVTVVEQEKELPQPVVEHVHLVNGDEIFGYVTHHENGILMAHPLKTDYLESDDQGGYMLTLVPYMPFSMSERIFIDRGKIITHAPVHSEMAKFYYFSTYFAEKQTDARFIDMVHNNVKMAMAIMDETIVEKKQAGENFIQPEVHQIN